MKPENIEIIVHLNRVLKNELTAINQYFVHAKMFENWGLHRIAGYEHNESIDEMKHADKLIERILFLEGLPNLQDPGSLYVGEDTEEMLECDLRLEMEALPIIKEAIAYSESISDFVSRELFENILESEEEHVDWLETQLDLIKRVGLQNYLQEQMHG